MDDLRGPEYLKKKLAQKQLRVEMRYNFYEMKYHVQDFRISTPPELLRVQTCLGWCGKAVDSIADRLQFMGLKNDAFGMGEIFMMNNQDVFFDSAIQSALIGSCAFVYLSPDGDGYPRLQVIDGRNATGRLDTMTGFLKEGYAVLDVDEYNRPVTTAYFTPEETVYREHGEQYSIPNPTAYPLLVPVIHRPDAKRPFGHSRISRACMDLVCSAARTIKRSEIAAEFYSFPQKYALGLSDDVEIDNKYAAAMSYMLTFYKDEDGDKPTVGQFTQQSMTPHLDQLRMFASAFAGETGLTLDDLGFPSANPSSAEAIKSGHENLRLAARRAQRNFESGFLNAGFLAASLRDGFPYQRQQIRDTKLLWEPIFEPDAAMLSGIGDGAIKINQAVPGYFGANNLRELTGIAENGGAD